MRMLLLRKKKYYSVSSNHTKTEQSPTSSSTQVKSTLFHVGLHIDLNMLRSHPSRGDANESFCAQPTHGNSHQIWITTPQRIRPLLAHYAQRSHVNASATTFKGNQTGTRTCYHHAIEFHGNLKYSADHDQRPYPPRSREAHRSNTRQSHDAPPKARVEFPKRNCKKCYCASSHFSTQIS